MPQSLGAMVAGKNPESLPTTCQICFNHFEPGKCLAHRCEGNCTSLICGTCLAQLPVNKCVQNCGNNPDHPSQHSHYDLTADDELTKALYERGLPDRARELDEENEELKSKKTLGKMLAERTRQLEREEKEKHDKEIEALAVKMKVLIDEKMTEALEKTWPQKSIYIKSVYCSSSGRVNELDEVLALRKAVADNSHYYEPWTNVRVSGKDFSCGDVWIYLEQQDE